MFIFRKWKIGEEVEIPIWNIDNKRKFALNSSQIEENKRMKWDWEEYYENALKR